MDFVYITQLIFKKCSLDIRHCMFKYLNNDFYKYKHTEYLGLNTGTKNWYPTNNV